MLGRKFFFANEKFLTTHKYEVTAMSKTDKYDERMLDIARRSNEMEETLLKPVVDKNGLFLGDADDQKKALGSAVKGSVYEGLGDGATMALGTHSKALQKYCRDNGHMPSAELMASVHKSIENAVLLTESDRSHAEGTIFESADMSTTDGILMRDRMVALILPTQLQTITHRMVTHIPGDFNQSEMFRIRRVAGSTFGDLTKGDLIDYDYNSRYSVMDQRWQAPDGDGTEVGGASSTTVNYFQFDSNTVYSTVYPLKKKSIKIYHDRDLVASDKDGDGTIYGSFVNASDVTVTVSGTVDYTNGTVNPVFSVAPVADIEVHIGYDVDIESDPTLIPKVDHQMTSALLYPHESAISANTTLQALWGLRREYNLNADNMAMAAMRNLMAADKDRKILADLYFFAKTETSWSMDVPDGADWTVYYESVKQTLLQIDTLLISQTGFAGLSGLVADPNACALFRAMRGNAFTPAPGYRKLAQPHYVGRLFGMWDLFEDPNGESYSALCYARGNNHGEAGYVVGDAIPALAFKHPTLTDLVYRSTLWELGYRDLNPFFGRSCFTTLKITTG